MTAKFPGKKSILLFSWLRFSGLLFLMPKREIKHPDKEKSTGAYSAAVEIDGWVYVSGQGPVDPRTAQPVRGTIEEETRYTLEHIKKILAAAGCTLDDVVKSTVHLA